jgi:hypothetical protein
MPRETKITDNTLTYDPSVGKKVRGPWWAKGESNTTKVTTVTRGGAIKKKIEDTSSNIFDKGKLNKNREIKVSKYNKAGELKKKVSLSNVEGVVKKVVSKPGEADKTKRVGIIAKARLKKNI